MSFTCEVDPEDRYAYVDFSRSLDGRLRGHFTSRFLVSASKLPNVYITPAIKRWIDQLPKMQGRGAEIAQTPVASVESTPMPLLAAGTTFEQEVLRVINQVRGEAGQSPVAFSDSQSNFNQKMAPYFLDDADRDVNQAVPAVMAGWEVDGFIIDGSFASRFD